MSARNILVTGAAGLIGGEVCARLARAGNNVFALVHRSPEVLGNDGTAVPVAGVLHGDVRAEGLGLSEAPQVDLVVHCAASLTFDAPYHELEAINVGGTRNVVAFAKAKGATLVHVSTAYVCGLRNGVIAEEAVAAGTHFANGYERSKAEAEAVVQASGLTHCIARPAIVLGDSTRGAIREFDAMYQTFAMIARGLLQEIPASPAATLDFVPIDHVAAGIVRLAARLDEASRDGANGAICHLTSGDPLPVEDFTQAIAAYPQFRAPELVAAHDFDPAALPAMQRRIWNKVASAYASYFQRNPRFDDSRFRTITGLSDPATGPEWFHRLIDFAIAGGLLPAAVPSAHQDTNRPAAPARRKPTASLP